MFEEPSLTPSSPAPDPRQSGLAPSIPGATLLDDVGDMVERLSSCGTDLPEEGIVDLLGVLESVKSAAAAYQARAAVALRTLIVERERAAGVREADLGAAAGAQLALARRESPFRGGRWMGFSRAVVTEMPHTHQAFRTGRISEWRAMLLVRETACLTLEDRQKVDEALMSDPKTTEGVGDRRLAAMAKHLADQADAEAVVRRARKAVGDRHVSLRPAPDTMGLLTGVLPVAQAVSVFKALSRAADLASTEGDPRSRGQVMADTLVERITGQARADDVHLEVQLVMSDRTLFQGDVEPAFLQGYGVVPAQIARDMVRGATRPAGLKPSRDTDQRPNSSTSHSGRTGQGAAPVTDTAPTVARGPAGVDEGMDKELVWLRRLYTAPGTGALVGLDSKARLFPDGLRRFIELRDQVCARPWCDAPIRHRDHVVAWAAGGRTSAANGDGLCESCNHTKEASGWKSRVLAGGRHTVETTTPTDHSYISRAPILPGAGG